MHRKEINDDPPPAGMAGKLMAECGLILKDLNAAGSPYHTLQCDQTEFTRKLDGKLKWAINHPINVDQFLGNFITYLESDETDEILVKALQPTRTSANALEKARGNIQESTIRLLLQIDDLQTKLISWLLEKLAIISLNDDGPGPSGDTGRKENTPVNKPQLILSQLRWLDRIVDGNALTDKFLDILDATSDQVSQEVIACLPEVIAETSNHEKIAKALRDKIDNNGYIGAGGPMTNVILDTMTNLTLSPVAASEIQTSILKSIDSFLLEDRPVLVKFILQSTASNNEAFTVSKLRENLNLENSQLLNQLSQRGRSRSKRHLNSNRSGENEVALIMDIIRVSMTKDRKMADAWFRAVEVAGKTFSANKKGGLQHKPLDIFLLVLLHGLPNRRRPVESLLKNKIRNGSFNDDLITKTFTLHKLALAAHFNTLHQMAECLLHSGMEPVLARFSTILHREMFVNFGRFSQQEIISDLVTNISSCGYSATFPGSADNISGGGSVRSSALSTLKYLSENYTSQMSNYSHFVAHILEYLDTMSLSQIRQVMDIISLLSYAAPEKANTVRDDVHIMVRKQLTTGGTRGSGNIKNKVKRMGIIGAVILVKNMSLAAMRDESERVETSRPSQDTSTGSTTSSTSILKQAIEVLERVKNATQNAGELAGLFMDELSCVVQEGKIAKEIVEWISTKMADEFQDVFVDDYQLDDLVEKDDYPNRNFYLPMSLQYNIENITEQDSNSEEPVVNIAIDLTKKSENSNSQSSWNEDNFIHKNSQFCNMVDCFIPHFRLLRVCVENRDEGDLGDIDALLGCPIWLPSAKVLERFDTLSNNERNHVCTILFSIINWFRELLNGFHNQFETIDEPEESIAEKKKVLLRLKGIQTISKELTRCLQYNSSYIPPRVLHLADISAWKPLSCLLSTKAKPSKIVKDALKKNKGKGKGRKRKELADNTNIQGMTTYGDNILSLPPGTDRPIENEIPDEPEASISSIDINHYHPFFRELDLETFNILKYDKVSTDLNRNENDIASENVKLSPADLLFLLNDLASKLDHSLVSAHTKKAPGFGIRSSMKGVGFSRLDSVGPVTVATKAVDLLSYLMTDVEAIALYFEGIVDASGGMIDFGHGLFDNPQNSILLKCMERSLTVVKSIFAWTGFSSKDQRALLKRGLARIAERTSNQIWTEHNSLMELIEASLKYLKNISRSIVDVSNAHALVKLIETVGYHLTDCSLAIADIENGLNLRRKIVHGLCKDFLQRSWYNPETGVREKGSQYNTHVEAMLVIYLNNHPIEGLGIDAIKNYVDKDSNVLQNVLKMSTEKKTGTKDEENTSSEAYPTFSKSTFLLHYRALFNHLVTAIKDNITFGTTKDPVVQLTIWRDAISLFHGK